MMRNLPEVRGLAKGCAVLALAGAAAGCANTGLMQTKGLSDSFVVNTDVDAAYRRALEYVRVCHKSRPRPYGVTYGAIRDGDLVESDESGFFGIGTDQDKQKPGKRKDLGRIRVFKVGEQAKILELISAKGESVEPVTTRVTVSVLDTGVWDQAELAAARKSIQSATPACRPLE